MCNRVDNEGLSIEEVSANLSAEIVEGNYILKPEVNAFDVPAMPIVLDHHGRKITHGTWRLYKEADKAKPGKGINLTAEKTHTFYRKFEHNRAVVPVTGFYDWMHLQNPGRKTPITVKHRMNWKDKDHFYIAAFYDVWDNGEIGFGLVTTVANELMSVVHNSKQRMPICMDVGTANRFLNDEPIESFEFPAYDPALVAVNLEPQKMPKEDPPIQTSLFD
ncbi:SOS response-associated peptidase family protein [Chryseobacterium sp. WX]|uniref:SOS response-associated peptidase family protein n=1 Tax=Chryseobacterium sp. WX TaxID=3031803 RepID=UPI00240A4550|nr:SOS response-associated peptidase family protein [Chryseobacterium sp. WX]WFB67097.1 SOS response-associated peptidase family protein [Chryseobacterium sp. WX]